MAAQIVQTRNGRDLAVPLLSLSQPYTGATAVLVDELDAAAFIAQQLAKLTSDAPFNPCLFVVLPVISGIARAKTHPT